MILFSLKRIETLDQTITKLHASFLIRPLRDYQRLVSAFLNIYLLSGMNFNPSSNMATFRALVCLAILSCCSAANFVMFPMFGRSHYMFYTKLGQELTERGHQVSKLIAEKLFILPAPSLQWNHVCSNLQDLQESRQLAGDIGG